LKGPGAAERFKEVAEAYDVLNEPKKRSEYAARGPAGVAGFSQEDLFGGIDFEYLSGGFATISAEPRRCNKARSTSIQTGHR
jgi:DnaJ-class molecular chaperone